MKKVILHCDLNCFFASVEMLYHPEFKNVPMAIGGDRENRHGIILAKNVLAKKAGVKTASTINEALQACPKLIIRDPDYDSYEYFSQKVRNIYYEYTDLVEPFGIDECWLDITSSISYFGSVEKIVNDLLFRVKNELGLTLSIGISFNKIYAKLGSDLASEDDCYYVNSLEQIEYMSADKLLGIGYKTYEYLKTYGIFTIGDIARKPLSYMHGILGKAGDTLYYYATGTLQDDVQKYFKADDIAKSIGNSMTSTRDLYDLDDIKCILTIICDSVSRRVKEANMYFKTIHLTTRTKKLEIKTMQVSLKENSDLGKDIFDNALKLFEQNCDFKIPYRSIGVSVSNLSFQKESIQMNLFENSSYSIKQRKKEQAIIDIRKRFGDNAVSSLRLLEDSNLSHYCPSQNNSLTITYKR